MDKMITRGRPSIHLQKASQLSKEWGEGHSIDRFGYKSVEVNYGKLYLKGIGFLVGLSADLPSNVKDATQLEGQTYEIFNFDRKGVMFEIAGLIGKPGKIAFGAKAGIGLQTSQTNGAVVDIGNSTIDAYLAGYTPVPGKYRSTLFSKAGIMILIPTGNMYLAFEGGVKDLVHPTERKNNYRPIEYQSRTGPYAGVGLEAKF